MNNILTETAGVRSPNKIKEVNTYKLFKRHYKQELDRICALAPTSRMNLIKQLLDSVELNGITESIIRFKCNEVLSKVGLPGLTDQSFQFLKLNHSLNSIHHDQAIIIACNKVLDEYNLPSQYTESKVQRSISDYRVNSEVCSLSSNELNQIHQGQVEKTKEISLSKFLEDVLEEHEDFNLVTMSAESIEVYMSSVKLTNKGIIYSTYSELLSQYNKYLLTNESYKVVRPHQQIDRTDFDKVIQIMANDTSINIQKEIQLFIIASTFLAERSLQKE